MLVTLAQRKQTGEPLGFPSQLALTYFVSCMTVREPVSKKMDLNNSTQHCPLSTTFVQAHACVPIYSALIFIRGFLSCSPEYFTFLDP